jgi:hypothetical protein
MGLLAGMANAQISGRVIAPDLTAIDSAHVEVWDSYPDGSKQTAVFCDINGNFTVSGLPAGTYDVRAWKEEASEINYTAYEQGVPYPYAGELLLVLVAAPDIIATPWSCDYSDPSSASTFLGYPLRRGDVVGVQDPDDVWCGMMTRFETDESDSEYLVHVYGDDGIGVDKGAEEGDILVFFINNKAATLVGGIGTWTNLGNFYFPLQSTSNDFEAVMVSGPADVSVAEGETVNLDFIVTNQGNHSDAFDLSRISVSGWDVSLPGGAATGPLNAGESATITVRVEVPTPISSYTTDDVYLLAASQANDVVMGVDKGFLEASPNAILEDEGTVPERYFLAQNYPNPFNPSTQIAFGLQVGGHTTVTVYNLLGQQVSQLLDEDQAAGSHVVAWDGMDNNGQPVPSRSIMGRGIFVHPMIKTKAGQPPSDR